MWISSIDYLLSMQIGLRLCLNMNFFYLAFAFPYDYNWVTFSLEAAMSRIALESRLGLHVGT